MDDSRCQRRTGKSSQVLQRFNGTSLPRLAFQDQKYFTVQVKTNHQNNHVHSKHRKSDVEPRRLFIEENDFSASISSNYLERSYWTIFRPRKRSKSKSKLAS